MATRQKKQQRRTRHKQQRSTLQGIPNFLRIVDGAADAGLTLESAEHTGEDDTAPSVSRFTMTAYTGGKMQVANFSDPVVVDLSGMRVPKKSRPILRDHDGGQIVGHTETIAINSGSIRLAGLLSAANDSAREVRESAINKFPWQASIGAGVQRAAFVDEGETVTVNGRKFTGPLIVVRQSTLREVSFVAIGADENTSAKVAASAATQIGVETMQFEQWLQAKGFDLAELSDEQKATLQASYNAEMTAADESDAGDGDDSSSAGNVNASASNTGTIDVDAEIQARRAAHVAETTRIARIGEICAQYDNPSSEIQGETVTIEARAIAEGWDENRTELEAMRESRPQAPAGHAHSREETHSLEAMQGGMLLQAGVALDHPSFGTRQALGLGLPRWMRAGINEDVRQQAMEAAYRFSDLSAIDICREAIRLDGQSIPSGRSKVIEAAFSGSSLTKIFTTSVNAALLATYQETTDTTHGWTRERDVADFKMNERIRMAKGPNLARLPRGGPADHYDRSDTQESYKLARYARQFVVDEQDIINNNLDAFSDIPQEMGLAAARLRPDLVYSILLANAALDDAVALFHAMHGNLKAGAALASATLIAAIAAIELQQENGVNLNLRSSHLIVPSELKHTGAELINSSQILLAGNTDSVRGNNNTINSIESLNLVSDSRLSNGVTDPTDDTVRAGSASTWFLVAANGHTIEVGFLRGSNRGPTSRSFTLDKGQWGMGWDVKMDIGAKALDHRSVEKNTA